MYRKGLTSKEKLQYFRQVWIQSCCQATGVLSPQAARLDGPARCFEIHMGSSKWYVDEGRTPCISTRAGRQIWQIGWTCMFPISFTKPTAVDSRHCFTVDINDFDPSGVVSKAWACSACPLEIPSGLVCVYTQETCTAFGRYTNADVFGWCIVFRRADITVSTPASHTPVPSASHTCDQYVHAPCSWGEWGVAFAFNNWCMSQASGLRNQRSYSAC